MNLRDQIIASKRRTLKVETPEWDCPAVYVACMSALERAQVVAENRAGVDAKESSDETSARLAIRAICDEAGKPAFTKDDTQIVKGLDAIVLNRVIEQWLAFNGVGAAAAETAEKNS